MFRGFYTVASGMIAQQRKTEVLTNNLGNANTPGYKADQASFRSFPEMLLSRMEQPASSENSRLLESHKVGALSTGVYMQETLPNFAQGQLLETQISTDFAIADAGLPAGNSIFFRLSSEEGEEQYTRNGNFTLDAEGFLVNPQGFYVLSENSAQIRLANDDFAVSPEGTIIQNGMEVAQIGVAFSADSQTLAKQGNGLFAAADGARLPSAYGAAAFTIQQGRLEGSNVDSSRTMTDLLTAYRAFEANQKVLQAYDRSMERAVNEIGRVN